MSQNRLFIGIVFLLSASTPSCLFTEAQQAAPNTSTRPLPDSGADNDMVPDSSSPDADMSDESDPPDASDDLDTGISDDLTSDADQGGGCEEPSPCSLGDAPTCQDGNTSLECVESPEGCPTLVEVPCPEKHGCQKSTGNCQEHDCDPARDQPFCMSEQPSKTFVCEERDGIYRVVENSSCSPDRQCMDGQCACSNPCEVGTAKCLQASAYEICKRSTPDACPSFVRGACTSSEGPIGCDGTFQVICEPSQLSGGVLTCAQRRCEETASCQLPDGQCN